MSVTYRSVSVPQGSTWEQVGAPFVLPEGVAAALAAAGGALVRTVYQLTEGDRELIALGYHRAGTAQQKLTELTGAVELFGELAEHAAEELAVEGGISLKVELPADATAWAEAVSAAGFVALAAPVSAAAPPVSADVVPLGFVRRLGDWDVPELPYFRQTTDFTCGPVSALTATNALGLTPALDPASEMELWRRATIVPACDAYGLAIGLADQGVASTVIVNTAEPLQLEEKPEAWRQDLSERTQAEFKARAEELGIPVLNADPGIAELLALVADGAIVLLLIDQLLMHADACAHWVTLHGVVGNIGFIEDPWTDSELGETWVDAHQQPVHAEALAKMSGWGEYRSAVVLGRS
ncbi:MAG TPA: hypothetical protein DCM67_07430 [Propionibacteriaceae bacterium]|nr:hypothetical protein [Propionibacteriaceae bacterium]